MLCEFPLDILKVFLRHMLKFFTFSYINSPASTLYLPNKIVVFKKKDKNSGRKKGKGCLEALHKKEVHVACWSKLEPYNHTYNQINA